MKKIAAVLIASALLAGCGNSPLIPNQTIALTAKKSVSLASLATAGVVVGAIYLIYDPLAPNWEIEESKVAPDVYRFSMKMKRYHTGGAGESVQILKRRASQLQYENGFGSYQILEYTEGIDSQTIGARRVAEGTIRLVQRQDADSFRLNEGY
ncbi:hypothetical protein [Dechloromonas sp. HYN0024]|uniref:hypothetical protein n=1 Tax=Dechloromonas sp. HYN0024 TaxID=2231055 RepID=UPI000E437DA5|nr:hypothetical protein [Dechloromonas sp. HYN0024]AXS79178.1 hypothetical protein HYN24_03485 [Dechloromonas sp. HYN0024]